VKKNYQLALLSAFLLWLAWPPIPFTALILLVALVPLLQAAENIIQSDEKKKGKLIWRIALGCFFIWNTACIYWVFNSLNAVMPPWLALIISQIPFFLGAILMALAFWLYFQLRKVASKIWSYAGFISFWIGYEYLHQSWDLAFPWMNLGNGFAESHYLVQWYEYTGVYGGTLWILISNILIFENRLAIKNKLAKIQKIKLQSATTAFILLPILVSILIYVNYEERENPANVVVVQPNIDPYEKFGSLSSSDQVEKLIQLSESVAQSNTEFFIWPETAISKGTEERTFRDDSNFIRIQQFLVNYKNANLISGIESYSIYETAKTETARYDNNSGIYFDVFNAAVLIENSAKLQFYHKSKLVPGVEQTPFSNSLSFLKPLFKAFGGSSGSYGKQNEPSVFYSQSGIGVAPVICYESIWGEYVSDYIKKDAQFIAILTNDGWWGNTSGKDQHLQYAKLRAIETRRWVARSANTGISAFINQRGAIVQRTTWWIPGAIKQDINLNEELTFYVRYGDYIAKAGTLATFAFLVFLSVALIKKRK
jgi:apolipoprotein N-acyltransferase